MYNLNSSLNISKPNNNRFYTIAVDGRGGAGKGTFTEYLKTLLPNFVFLNGDDYFEPTDNQIVWGAFNENRWEKEVIEPLQKGNKFLYRPYKWNVEKNISEREVIVTDGICIERCYSFAFVIDWDLKIWIDTPREICLERGITRNLLPKEQLLYAWKIWQEREDEYIRTTKPMEHADIVLDGTIPFTEQVSI